MVNNTVIVGILGFAFAACLLTTKFVGDAQKEYKQTIFHINEINAETESFKAGKDGFLRQYDISELKENYVEPTISGNKTIMNVPIINQFPELPTGCEITSATAILNYVGFNVDKVYMQENFLASSSAFYFNAENKRVGPDPGEYFVGNPKEKGLGCFSTVIVDTINKFFRANKSTYYAINLVNGDQKTLETLLDNGIPIEVWASIDMKPFKFTASNEWIVESTGETLHWIGNAHALVLVGYDDENYYFADCANKKEIQKYKKTDFLARWEQFNKQGVIIKLS